MFLKIQVKGKKNYKQSIFFLRDDFMKNLNKKADNVNFGEK